MGEWPLAAIVMTFSVALSYAHEPDEPPPAPATTNESSWRVLSAMWKAIRADDKRISALRAGQYYVESFASGAPPLPYRAYHRVKVTLRGAPDEQLIVVNRQGFRPFQDTYVPDYHGAEFYEEELIFDATWRFKSKRRWVWGTPSEPSVPTPAKLVYGIHPGQAGELFTRMEKDQLAVQYQDGKRKASVAYTQAYPSCEVFQVLLPVGADLISGDTIRWGYLSGGVDDAYRVTRGSMDGPGGTPKRIFRLVGPEGLSFRYYSPLTGEYGSSHNQCSIDYKASTEATYQRALRKFLEDFKVDELTDKQGKAVDLPLGLEKPEVGVKGPLPRP